MLVDLNHHFETRYLGCQARVVLFEYTLIQTINGSARVIQITKNSN